MTTSHSYPRPQVVRDQDVRNFTVNKESSVSLAQDGRPVVTINVNRK